MAGRIGVDACVEFDKWRDWLKANGRRQSDEAAGFRNWLRKAAEFKPKQSRADLIQAVNAEIFKGSTNDRLDERTIDGEAQRVA